VKYQLHQREHDDAADVDKRGEAYAAPKANGETHAKQAQEAHNSARDQSELEDQRLDEAPRACGKTQKRAGASQLTMISARIKEMTTTINTS
jgi:hypothetical protein